MVVVFLVVWLSIGLVLVVVGLVLIEVVVVMVISNGVVKFGSIGFILFVFFIFLECLLFSIGDENFIFGDIFGEMVMFFLM